MHNEHSSKMDPKYLQASAAGAQTTGYGSSQTMDPMQIMMQMMQQQQQMMMMFMQNRSPSAPSQAHSTSGLDAEAVARIVDERVGTELQRVREEAERKEREAAAELQRVREEAERKEREAAAQLQRVREEAERKEREHDAALKLLREAAESKARVETERVQREQVARNEERRAPVITEPRQQGKQQGKQQKQQQETPVITKSPWLAAASAPISAEQQAKAVAEAAEQAKKNMLPAFRTYTPRKKVQQQAQQQVQHTRKGVMQETEGVAAARVIVELTPEQKDAAAKKFIQEQLIDPYLEPSYRALKKLAEQKREGDSAPWFRLCEHTRADGTQVSKYRNVTPLFVGVPKQVMYGKRNGDFSAYSRHGLEHFFKTLQRRMRNEYGLQLLNVSNPDVGGGYMIILAHWNRIVTKNGSAKEGSDSGDSDSEDGEDSASEDGEDGEDSASEDGENESLWHGLDVDPDNLNPSYYTVLPRYFQMVKSADRATQRFTMEGLKKFVEYYKSLPQEEEKPTFATQDLLRAALSEFEERKQAQMWAESEEATRVEAERKEAERVEAERLKRQQAEREEAERVEAERVKAERVEAERKEAERKRKQAKKAAAAVTPADEDDFDADNV